MADILPESLRRHKFKHLETLKNRNVISEVVKYKCILIWLINNNISSIWDVYQSMNARETRASLEC